MQLYYPIFGINDETYWPAKTLQAWKKVFESEIGGQNNVPVPILRSFKDFFSKYHNKPCEQIK